MATIKFKTNAKCGGCVAAIGAKLNTLMASDDWSIDLADPNKVLEVKVDLAPAIVIAAVKEAESRVISALGQHSVKSLRAFWASFSLTSSP